MSRTRGVIGAALVAALCLTGCEQARFGDADRTPRDAARLTFELDPDDIRRGRRIYDKHCLSCHGQAGKGTVLAWRIRDADGHLPPPPLNGSARAALLRHDALVAIIRDGSPSGSGKMPGWNTRLSAREIENVVSYIRSLWTPAVHRLWWNAEQHAPGT